MKDIKETQMGLLERKNKIYEMKISLSNGRLDTQHWT